MAEHRLSAEQVRLIVDGFARVEPHPDGVVIVVGRDRLVLSAEAVGPLVLPLFAGVESVMGEALLKLARQHHRQSTPTTASQDRP